MSGIFKGDSIYKSGGGAGGYKDGGALVDATYIDVQNNVISTYTNDSRNVVNFVIHADGNPVNTIVELTNDVNATINVYVYNDGVYIPLGNVGGNTVNAGEQYNINIVGNSFVIENVVGYTGDEYVLIDETLVKVFTIGSFIWTDYLTNYKPGNNPDGYPWCRTATNPLGTGKDYVYQSYPYAKTLQNSFFKLPTQQDITDFQNELGLNGAYKLKSTSQWHNNRNGSDVYGFGAYPTGQMDIGGNFYPIGQSLGYGFYVWGKDVNAAQDRVYCPIINWNSDNWSISDVRNYFYLPTRLVARKSV